MTTEREENERLFPLPRSCDLAGTNGKRAAILGGLLRGESDKVIRRQLGNMPMSTFRGHVKMIFTLFGVADRGSLIKKVWQSRRSLPETALPTDDVKVRT